MILILVILSLGYLVWYTFKLNKAPENFPKGPISLPIIGSLYALGKEPYKSLMKMKSKYGNVIGIDFGSSRGIILNDYQVIKEAFSRPELCNRPNFESNEVYYKNNCKGLLWEQGNYHYDEKRQFVMKTLKRLGTGKRSMEVMFLEQLNQLFEHFDGQIGKSLVNETIFQTVTIRALWTIISGKSYSDEDEDFNASVNTVIKLVKSLSSSGGISFFPFISKLFPNVSGWNNYHQCVLAQRAFIEKTIQSHVNSNGGVAENPADFIDCYLEKIAKTSDTNSSFYGQTGRDNLLVVIQDLFMAGTESVANCLTWVITVLLLNPDVQDKMQIEIDKVIGSVTPPSLEDRNKMPYAEAFILEIIRYSSLAPMGVPRETLEDTYLQEYFIPKGTIVVPNYYGVLHDPDLWKNPHIFDPTRFLNSDGSMVVKNNAVNFAFGSGKRTCVAETMVRDQLFLLTVGLIQRYSFNPDPSHLLHKLETHLTIVLLPKPHSFVIYKRC